MQYENIPEELKVRKQWVLWRHEMRNEKMTKVPYQPSGNKAESNNAETWSTFEDVTSVASKYSGIGYVFSKDDSYCGVDLDHCIENGVLELYAQQILDQLESYTEVSPSKTGVHTILKIKDKFAGRSKYINKEKGQKIECYSQGRYFTFTGDVFQGRDVIRNFNEIDSWFSEMFPKNVSVQRNEVGHGLLLPPDEDIIRVAQHSKHGERFSKLFEGKWEEVGYGSQSEADLSLCSTLAFFAEADTATIDRIFRTSKLMRPKWDEVHFSGNVTYGQATVKKATGGIKETMQWNIQKVAIPIQKDTLPFKNLSLAQVDSELRDFVFEGYIMRGRITMIPAMYKVGKTTFLVHLCKALANGDPFLELETKKGNVLFISEESEGDWAERRETYGLEDNIFIACQPFLANRPNVKRWTEYFENIAHHAVQQGITTVVIDTLSNQWGCEDEDKASQVVPWLNPLRVLTKSNLAVVLIHHIVKNGGNVDTAMRGSGAFGAFVDGYVSLTRPKGDDTSNFRTLTTRGRGGYTDVQLLMELVDKNTEDERYISHGETKFVSHQGKMDAMKDILTQKDENGTYKWFTIKEIVEELSVRLSGVKVTEKMVRGLLTNMKESVIEKKHSRPRKNGTGSGFNEYSFQF